MFITKIFRFQIIMDINGHIIENTNIAVDFWKPTKEKNVCII